MLVRRELLSLLWNLYDFAHQCRERPCRLWRSAAREAGWVSVLLLLCPTDLRVPWDLSVTCSDASLSGIAVCKREARAKEIQQIGRQREGWRFKAYEPSSCPRGQTVEKGRAPDVFADPITVKPLGVLDRHDPFQLNQSFEEISQSFMCPGLLHFCYAARMGFKEHITLLEARGIVGALRHKLRSSSSFGKRHLHVNDNLASVLIAEKGRSASYEMVCVSGRAAALLIASGSLLITRWAPSEWNVADAGSQQWEAQRRQADPKCKTSDALCYPSTRPCRARRHQSFGPPRPPLQAGAPARQLSLAGLCRDAAETSACPRVNQERFPGQTLLEQHAVSEKVGKEYKQRHQQFQDFCKTRCLSLRACPNSTQPAALI